MAIDFDKLMAVLNRAASKGGEEVGGETSNTAGNVELYKANAVLKHFRERLLEDLRAKDADKFDAITAQIQDKLKENSKLVGKAGYRNPDTIISDMLDSTDFKAYLTDDEIKKKLSPQEFKVFAAARDKVLKISPELNVSTGTGKVESANVPLFGIRMAKIPLVTGMDKEIYEYVPDKGEVAMKLTRQ